MPTGKQSQNKPLISLTEGKKVGEIKDLFLDETLNKLTGVFVGSEGLINRKNLAIDRAAVQLIGADAWLVTDSHVVIAPEGISNSASFVLLNDLRGREIVSEGGTNIGAVEDVIFDHNGTIQGFVLGKIQVKGTLAERKAIARSAISTIGGKQSAMTANMALAESTEVAMEHE